MTVPKLRFPEFQNAGEWEEKKLGEVFTRITTKNAENNLNSLTISAQDGLVNQLDYFNKKISAKDLTGYYLINAGDFAYNKSYSNGYPMGAIKRLKLYEKGVVSTLYICFRANSGYSQSFFEQYFDFGMINNAISGIAQEGARNHGLLNISIKDFFDNVNVSFPSTSEQQKIADCLRSIDSLIAAETQKLDTLKAHKKGLMQQLFPAEGETFPKLRFPEFRDAGDWEERRLDQLVGIQSGGTPSKANSAFWNGSVPWVSAKDMKQLFLTDTEDHISKAAIDDGAKLVPSGTILMLIRGMTLLKDVPICVLRREMSFNQDVKALRPKFDVNAFFLAWMLTGNKQRLREMVGIAGHGTGKLDTDELKAFLLTIPQPEEQQCIADCLSSLDDRISAQTQKIATLKTHKKGLMQQLFPAIDEVI